MSDYKQTRDAAGKVVSQYSAMLSSIDSYEDLARRHQHALHKIDVLEDKIEKLLSALGKVQAFVKDLEPYADQGTTLHPALYEACMVYERLK